MGEARPHIEIEQPSFIERKAVQVVVRQFSESVGRICGSPLRPDTVRRVSVRTILPEKAFRNEQGFFVGGIWAQQERTVYLFHEQIAGMMEISNITWEDVARHEFGHALYDQQTGFSVLPSDDPRSSTATAKEAFSAWMTTIAQHNGQELAIAKKLGRGLLDSPRRLFESSTASDYPSSMDIESDAAQLHFIAQNVGANAMNQVLAAADEFLKKRGDRLGNYGQFETECSAITQQSPDELLKAAHEWYRQQMRKWW